MKRLIPALALGLLSTAASAQSGQPIKIAGSFELSGPVAVIGQQAKAGVEFAVETLNKRGGVLGRPLSLELQDNGGNTQRAVNQSMQLARDGGISMLMAPQSSGLTLAVTGEVSAKLKMPMCVGTSAADDITMKAFQPYMFALSPSQYMMFRALAVRVAKINAKRIGIIAADTAGGHIGNERFKAFLKELAPQSQVVVEEFVKLSAPDHTASLNKLMAAQPDFVFGNLFGTDVLTVYKQGSAIGFYKQLKNQVAVLVDSVTLKNLGQEAVAGSLAYTQAPFNYIMKSGPEGRDYVQKFKDRYGDYPGDQSTMNYDCVMTWAAAVEAAKTTNADEVLKVLTTREFNSPRGKFRIAAFDHQAAIPVYFGHIVQSKEFGQPVMEVDEMVLGEQARPSEAVVMQARQAK